MSFNFGCCCAEESCLGCTSDPTSFRLDFSEITYKGGGGLTASGSWDNGISACSDGHRRVTASREFPDISDFGDATVLSRFDDETCSWGMADAEVYGERRDEFLSPNCLCSLAAASVYGGTDIGDDYNDWDTIKTAVASTQAAAQASDCGDVAICSGETRTVDCENTAHRKGVRVAFGKVGTEWVLTLQWRALGTLGVRYGEADFGGEFYNVAFAGNFASIDFNLAFGAGFGLTQRNTAYTDCFQSVWPDSSYTSPSRSDLQWTYKKTFDCDDLDGSAFTLSLQDSTTVNAQFAATYINNPPATVTLVAL